MKLLNLIIATLFFISACTTSPSELTLNSNLSKVEENHYETTIDNNKIILDSYIILFQRPYYISLKSEKPVSYDMAEKIAVDYIKPRGCTSSVKRIKKLDKSNANQTHWLIGVEC